MAIEGGLRVGQIGISLIVHDVTAATEFYCTVLGAEKTASYFTPRSPEGSSQVASVELRFGEAYLTVQQENPRWREAPRPDWPRSPVSAGSASVGFTLYVDDVDDVFARALEAGATSQTPHGPQSSHWGDRVVQINDPFGHLWRLQTRIEDVTFEDFAERLEHRTEKCEAVFGPIRCD
jgi:PhnB protein